MTLTAMAKRKRTAGGIPQAGEVSLNVLTDKQIERYSRQLLLPEIGGRGQDKLLAARVLVVGAGGLGSPAALYLAGAGVGTIGIVDQDCADLSNLHRQIAHTLLDLGRPKTLSLEEKIRIRNPDVQVIAHTGQLNGHNAESILADYDFILDGTDNFAGKVLIADACHLTGKPYSHAGVVQFRGQAMTVLPGQTTCYRCVFGEPPPPDAVPTCAETGVLGPAAGVLACIQAAEAIKFFTGAGNLLTDCLLVADLLAMTFRKVPQRRNPECRLCGKHPLITQLTCENAARCTQGCCRHTGDK
jgi:molybdopterin/thiamine biosynthesis adenylyltransferase